MHTFVTKIDESHPANPKPLYKTHKKDENGKIKNPCPIRNVTVACGTPIANLAKLMQCCISHLTSKELLPLRTSSTNEVLKRIIEMNDKHAPFDENAKLVFPDITAMYPNADVEEAIAIIGELLNKYPTKYGLSTESIVKALRLCQALNCVQFRDRFYLPCRGCAMGPAHGCDLTDIWVGPIAEKQSKNCPVGVDFSIYRDDGLDVLKNGDADLPAFVDHLESLHPNLSWETVCGKEGPYLDLWLKLENGRIESRVYSKSDPIYLHPSSCHDTAVFKGIIETELLKRRGF